MDKRNRMIVLAMLVFCILPLSATAARNQPQANLSDHGPWLLYLATDEGETLPYLWGINAEGSGRTRLSEQPVLNFAVNPSPQPYTDHYNVAYIGTSPDDLQQDIALYFLTLPAGTISDPIPLTSEDTAIHKPEDPNVGVGSNVKGDIAAGLADAQSLVWSPDAKWLAFVGAMDGVSLDVYSYELATGTVRRLTSGPDHAFQLWWTLDSSQIMHTSKVCFLCAGGPYEQVSGIWGAAPDGSRVITYAGPGAARFVAWRDATHLLMDTGPRNGGLANARILDIASETTESLDLGFFEIVAYDDAGRYVLLNSGDTELLNAGRGLYFVDLDSRHATFLRDLYATLWWDRFEQRFLVSDDQGFFAVTTDGMWVDDPVNTSRASSPDGRYVAIFNSAPRRDWTGGLWLQIEDAEPVPLLDSAAIALEWSADSQSFYYDIGQPGLYLIIAETMQVIELSTEFGQDLSWPYYEIGWHATWVPG